MNRQQKALLQLLEDDDEDTVRLVKHQLAGNSVEALPNLRSLLAAAREPAISHLREVLAKLESREAGALFAEYCRDFEEHGDLESAAWKLAAVFLPGETFEDQRAQLDAWGEEVVKRLTKAGSEAERAETLVEYLGDELRLRGNVENYYDISNSLLPEVIETRLGIPISISLVYLLVGRRAGLEIEGVGLPGHFIIRHGPDFFDPFNGGRRIGLEECRALLEQQGEVLTAQHLIPATPRQILRRMLSNLNHLAAPGDPQLAATIAGWIQALDKATDTE